jgi:hypothetical protein
MKDEQELYNLLSSRIPPEAWQSTFSIVLIHEKELHQFGTGTLFKVADQSFIVTAGHIVKDAHRENRSLCIAGANTSFVQILGNWLCSTGGQYGSTDDLFDIAVLEIDASTIDRLVGRAFLRLDEVYFADDLSKGIFCVLGFPAIWSRPSVDNETALDVKPIQYTTDVYEGPTDFLGGYDSRFHLLLNADPAYLKASNGNPLNFTDRAGQPAEFPRGLGGLSGGSVWQIGVRATQIKDLEEYHPRIVGIQTGIYHARGVIKATRWIAVSTLLYEAFPKLRPAMRLWYVD